MEKKINSKNMKTVKIFENLPPWARGAIALATVGVTGIVLYKGYKFLKDRKEAKDSRKVVSGSLGEYKRLKREGLKLAHPTTVYESTSNLIQKKLEGCEGSVDEIQVIEQIMKTVRTPIDWYYLVYVFGDREISTCGTFGFSKNTYDLSTLLKDQLDHTLIGDKVGNERYWGDKAVSVLAAYLKKIGITL